jgi:hypothetical protein
VHAILCPCTLASWGVVEVQGLASQDVVPLRDSIKAWGSPVAGGQNHLRRCKHGVRSTHSGPQPLHWRNGQYKRLGVVICNSRSIISSMVAVVVKNPPMHMLHEVTVTVHIHGFSNALKLLLVSSDLLDGTRNGCPRRLWRIPSRCYLCGGRPFSPWPALLRWKPGTRRRPMRRIPFPILPVLCPSAHHIATVVIFLAVRLDPSGTLLTGLIRESLCLQVVVGNICVLPSICKGWVRECCIRYGISVCNVISWLPTATWRCIPARDGVPPSTSPSRLPLCPAIVTSARSEGGSYARVAHPPSHMYLGVPAFPPVGVSAKEVEGGNH